MTKTKTYFEQVPLALAKQIVAKQAKAASSFLVMCRICGTPVGLELCKVDESGNAVHERCYIDGLAKSLPAKRQPRASSRV